MRPILALSVILLLGGCSASAGRAYREAPARSEARDNRSMDRQPPSPVAYSMEEDEYYEESAAEEPGTGGAYLEPSPAPSTPVQPAKTEPKETQNKKELDARMVVYQGYLKLRVKRVLEAIEAVTEATAEAKGYVESLGATVVVVRIPASDFEAVMERFARVGEVLDRQVRAVDVTQQFTDVRARLLVAKEARDRLVELLEKVEDVHERLRILQEIKRLSEQIEAAESTLAAIRNLVDYFTITIELEPVLDRGVARTHKSPFSWVRALTAHWGSIREGGDRVSLQAPAGFVVFDEEDNYVAQAADTTVVRAGCVENDPIGTSSFWADAVDYEMDGRDEERIDTGEVGGLYYRVYRDKDVQPRSYLVGVKVASDEVCVVEVFYPNQEAYEAHRQAVLSALATFRIAD